MAMRDVDHSDFALIVRLLGLDPIPGDSYEACFRLLWVNFKLFIFEAYFNFLVNFVLALQIFQVLN